IALRPLRQSDFDAIFSVAADPLIWEQHPARDRWQEPVFRKLFNESMASGGALVAIDRSTGKIIGWSRYHGYSAEASEVEIGWTFLARAYWGGKYNGEMKRLMIEHAFRFVDSVLFLVGDRNLRSQRAMQKIGGVRVGTRPDAAGRQNFVYRITATEFAQRAL